ncbi:MAG TPA: hypothetical protein VMD59_05375 [Acidimicrobiales bacterium]|nr:hypothetical protein [Acidimicrobiales bacterium]
MWVPEPSPRHRTTRPAYQLVDQVTPPVEVGVISGGLGEEPVPLGDQEADRLTVTQACHAPHVLEHAELAVAERRVLVREEEPAIYPPRLERRAATSSLVGTSSGLFLTGTTALDGDSGVACLEAEVDPASLALSYVTEPRCDDPRLSGERVVPVEEPLTSQRFNSEVRLARLTGPDGRIDLTRCTRRRGRSPRRPPPAAA